MESAVGAALFNRNGSLAAYSLPEWGKGSTECQFSSGSDGLVGRLARSRGKIRRRVYSSFPVRRRRGGNGQGRGNTNTKLSRKPLASCSRSGEGGSGRAAVVGSSAPRGRTFSLPGRPGLGPKKADDAGNRKTFADHREGETAGHSLFPTGWCRVISV